MNGNLDIPPPTKYDRNNKNMSMHLRVSTTDHSVEYRRVYNRIIGEMVQKEVESQSIGS
jgi:hypothetical protein